MSNEHQNNYGINQHRYLVLHKQIETAATGSKKQKSKQQKRKSKHHTTVIGIDNIRSRLNEENAPQSINNVLVKARHIKQQPQRQNSERGKKKYCNINTNITILRIFFYGVVVRANLMQTSKVL